MPYFVERNLDPASIDPLHLDQRYERLVTDMKTDVVFQPAVVEEFLTSNPDRSRTAFEYGDLTLRTYDDLSFGLTLCDDRIAVGIYGSIRTHLLTS